MAAMVYTEELGDRICELIATTSQSLKTICSREGMPSVRTVLNWLNPKHPSHQDSFLHQYAHAREAQADYLAEEILEIADDGTNDYMTITKGDLAYNVEDKEVTNRSKLRVDARKWLAGKLLPKKYGDKVDVTTGGEKLPSTTHVVIVPPLEDGD